jgi:hypothetical protein
MGLSSESTIRETISSAYVLIHPHGIFSEIPDVWKWQEVIINDGLNINCTVLCIEERCSLLTCCNRHGVHFVFLTVNIETFIAAGCVLNKPTAHSTHHAVVSVNGSLEPVVAAIEMDATIRSWTSFNVIV